MGQPGWFDWRRWLIYIHRWLGIAGCLVFLAWFVSGVIMMYERMPRLTPEERLARLERLDTSRLATPLSAALDHVGGAPEQIRIGMAGSRPVYRIRAAGEWTTVFADTGEMLTGMPAADAVATVARFYPESASTARAVERLTQPDQWLLDGGLSQFLPMHRVALGDESGTDIYVSERTGEPVMKTTARGRAWGYAGAVIHWTYFTPFRMQRELWRYSIIYAALIGCVMCLSGLIVGIWRFSPFKRFRLKRVPSHSPYAGWMWWHHYAGLVFGLFTFTWALSGALSLTPWDWAPSTDATDTQRETIAGGSFRADVATPDAIRQAVARLSRQFVVKEVEVLQFGSRPFVLAYQSGDIATAALSKNRDVSAIFNPQLAIPHASAWLDAAGAPTFERLDTHAIEQMAPALLPGAPVVETAWLSEYDSYYYDRTGSRPLPVLRATYDDADRTAMYLDPQSGLISMRQTTLSRANRWLYNGLHSLDFPFLYYSRPAWDIVVVGLSIGGLALTITTMVPAFRRLRRHARHLRNVATQPLP
jgi:hypothetical protein